MKKLIVLCSSIALTFAMFIGFASPAQAASITPTATSTGSIGTSGTNASPITITATVVSAAANNIQILIPTGWSFNGTPGGAPSPTCPVEITTSLSAFDDCYFSNSMGVVVQKSSALGSGTVVTVTFAANSLTLAAARDFYVNFRTNGLAQDTGVATAGATVAPVAPSAPVAPAVEDPTLPHTGITTAAGISLLAGGLSLALVGAEMFMIARRKRSNL